MPGKYFGKYTGVVKDNGDDQNMGQLQVTVPAIFSPDEVVTARAALPYGVYFVPEIGTKIWVEFEGGDLGLPIWTGVQFAPGEWPEEAKGIPPDKRLIKTKSGHVLLFDDTSGEEGIDIQDGVNAHRVTMNKDGIQVQDGVNQHRLSLDSSGITVEALSGAKIVMAADGITIDAGPGLIKLGASAAQPIIRVGDQGIGNLGAPVIMAPPGNPKVLA